MGRFDPTEPAAPVARHPGDRGLVALRGAVVLADPRSESPMKTRIRVAIHRHGLPPPELQHPVGPYRLDLAHPRVRLAVEYDGRDHRTPRRAVRDLRREAYLSRVDRDVLRLDAATVHIPREVARRRSAPCGVGAARGRGGGATLGSSGRRPP